MDEIGTPNLIDVEMVVKWTKLRDLRACEWKGAPPDRDVLVDKGGCEMDSLLPTNGRKVVIGTMDEDHQRFFIGWRWSEVEIEKGWRLHDG